MSEKFSKLLFLDCDGVLTSIESGTSYLCCDPDKYAPDHTIKLRFEWLRDLNPGLGVVISSAWCNFEDQYAEVPEPRSVWHWNGADYNSPLPAVQKWLKAQKMFLGQVDGKRRDSNGVRITKFSKISYWLYSHNQELEQDCRVAVIDDDDTDANNLTRFNTQLHGALGVKTHFFKTDPQYGFSAMDLIAVDTFFNQD